MLAVGRGAKPRRNACTAYQKTRRVQPVLVQIAIGATVDDLHGAGPPPDSFVAMALA
jgi:hypothetical protein